MYILLIQVEEDSEIPAVFVSGTICVGVLLVMPLNFPDRKHGISTIPKWRMFAQCDKMLKEIAVLDFTVCKS